MVTEDDVTQGGAGVVGGHAESEVVVVEDEGREKRKDVL